MTDAGNGFQSTRSTVIGNDALFADAYDKPLVAYLTRVGSSSGISEEDAREIVQSWWHRHFDRRARRVATIRETFDAERGQFRHYVSHDLWLHAREWLRRRGVWNRRFQSLGALGDEGDLEPAAEAPELDEVRERARALLNDMRDDVASCLPSEQHRRYFTLKWPPTERVTPTDTELQPIMGLTKHQVAALKSETLDALCGVLKFRLRAGRPFLERAESELLENNLERFGKVLEALEGEPAEDGDGTPGASPDAAEPRA